jgi:hypothetical protein
MKISALRLAKKHRPGENSLCINKFSVCGRSSFETIEEVRNFNLAKREHRALFSYFKLFERTYAFYMRATLARDCAVVHI